MFPAYFLIEVLHEQLTSKEEILFRFCWSMFIPSDSGLFKSTYKISNLQKPVIFLIRCTEIHPASKYLSKRISENLTYDGLTTVIIHCNFFEALKVFEIIFDKVPYLMSESFLYLLIFLIESLRNRKGCIRNWKLLHKSGKYPEDMPPICHKKIFKWFILSYKR